MPCCDGNDIMYLWCSIKKKKKRNSHAFKFTEIKKVFTFENNLGNYIFMPQAPWFPEKDTKPLAFSTPKPRSSAISDNGIKIDSNWPSSLQFPGESEVSDSPPI